VIVPFAIASNSDPFHMYHNAQAVSLASQKFKFLNGGICKLFGIFSFLAKHVISLGICHWEISLCCLETLISELEVSDLFKLWCEFFIDVNSVWHCSLQLGLSAVSRCRSWQFIGHTYF